MNPGRIPGSSSGKNGHHHRWPFFFPGGRAMSHQQELQAAVESAIQNHTDLKEESVDVVVDGDTIVLSGEISDRKKRHLAEALADQVPEVKRVINQLRVKNLLEGYVPGEG